MMKKVLNDFIETSYAILPLKIKLYLKSHKLSAHDIFDIDLLSEKSNIPLNCLLSSNNKSEIVLQKFYFGFLYDFTTDNDLYISPSFPRNLLC